MKANQHPKMSRIKYQAILMCPIPHEMDGFLVEQCPLWPVRWWSLDMWPYDQAMDSRMPMDTLWQQSLFRVPSRFYVFPQDVIKSSWTWIQLWSFFVESTHEEITIDAADTPWSAFFRHLRYDITNKEFRVAIPTSFSHNSVNHILTLTWNQISFIIFRPQSTCQQCPLGNMLPEPVWYT